MSPLASTSKVQLAYLEEATPGTTPVAGTPTLVRTTGESLAYAIQSESSKEINASRQVSDRVHVGASASGGLNIEMNYRGYDPFLEALLGGLFSTAFGTDGVEALTVTIDKTANTITDDGVDGFAGLVVGQWISLIDTVANDGVYRIATHTDDVLTIDTDTPLLADATADACSVTSSRLSCGTAVLRHFSIEKNFTDVTQFFMYRGMAPSKLSLAFASGSLLTGAFDFMGFNSERGGATLMPGAPAAAQAFGIMNAVVGVGSILIDDAPIAGSYVKSMNISLDGKLRAQTAIGNLGSVGLGAGQFEFGGTLEFYLADGSLYDSAIANNTISVQFPVYDVDNNGYAFIFANVKLDVPTVTAGSMDSDVMLSAAFNAVAPDTSTDKMVVIDRFGVAAV